MPCRFAHSCRFTWTVPRRRASGCRGSTTSSGWQPSGGAEGCWDASQRWSHPKVWRCGVSYGSVDRGGGELVQSCAPLQPPKGVKVQRCGGVKSTSTATEPYVLPGEVSSLYPARPPARPPAQIHSISDTHAVLSRYRLLPSCSPVELIEYRFRGKHPSHPSVTILAPDPVGQWTFGEYRAWEDAAAVTPPPAQALALLHRLAADRGIVGVMQRRQWSVGCLSEMPPEGESSRVGWLGRGGEGPG